MQKRTDNLLLPSLLTPPAIPVAAEAPSPGHPLPEEASVADEISPSQDAATPGSSGGVIGSFMLNNRSSMHRIKSDDDVPEPFKVDLTVQRC